MKRLFLLQLLLSAAVLAAAVRAQDTNYVTRSDLAAYAPLSALDDYATTASLAGYVLLSDLSAYATLSDLAGFVSATNLTNYPTRSDLAAYATAADLAGLATTASLSSYALLSDLSAYATSSDLDDYATTADLAAYATTANLAAATASASNSFLHATPDTIGSNTIWRIPARTDFQDCSLFGEDVTFEDDVFFDDRTTFYDSITFGNETRTNWPGARSITVGDGESAWVDDGLVWTDPDDSDVSIYLAHVTNATDRAHTVVIRDIGTDDGTVTDIYEGTSDPPVLVHTLTPTNRTAVFDWCPTADTWYLR